MLGEYNDNSHNNEPIEIKDKIKSKIVEWDEDVTKEAFCYHLSI